MKKEKKETEMKGGENISQSQRGYHKKKVFFFLILGHPKFSTFSSVQKTFKMQMRNKGLCTESIRAI